MDRQPLEEISLISGRGLVQVLVTNINPFSLFVFINGDWISPVDFEDLTLHVRAPEEDTPAILSGQLSIKLETAAGTKEPRLTHIFPGTIQISALRRFLQVNSQDEHSLDTLWIGVGLAENGMTRPLEGVKELKIFLTSGILDASITWMDGTVEKIFQSTQEVVN